MRDEGGGASRSTDPAAGSSAATDVSLREHLEARIVALDRLHESQRADDQTALTKALESAQELAAKHNDLIRQMERKDATYATKEDIDRLNAALSQVLPREVFTNIVDQWTAWRTTVDADRARLSGVSEGSTVTKATMIAYLGAAATALGVVIVLANILTTN